MRPIPKWVVRQIIAEVRRDTARQVREYGVDPRTEVLILRVRLVGGTPEWRAFGATYPYREALKRAGMRWCPRRGHWYIQGTPPHQEALADVPHKHAVAREALEQERAAASQLPS